MMYNSCTAQPVCLALDGGGPALKISLSCADDTVTSISNKIKRRIHNLPLMLFVCFFFYPEQLKFVLVHFPVDFVRYLAAQHPNLDLLLEIFNCAI